MPAPDCPLCHAPGTRPLGQALAGGRRIRQCPRCSLAFIESQTLPSPAEEHERYLRHRNLPDDPGYLAFLAPVVQAVRRTVLPGAHGLDFGCGPTPVLANLLETAGYTISRYDPYFAADGTVLAARYDFLVANEVIEHFRDPAAAFTILAGLLSPGGWLFLRTGRPPRDPSALLRWHYLSDPTHLAFYYPETLAWIAARHGWSLLEEPVPGLWVLRNERRIT